MAARKADPAAQAKRHLKAAEGHLDHLDGHMMVMHHLGVALVHALLGNAKEVQAAIDRADQHATSDAYKVVLADPVFVREYELEKAKIQAALSIPRK